jgi:hypothetical protein
MRACMRERSLRRAASRESGVRVRRVRVTTRGSEVGYLVRERNGVEEDGRGSYLK